MRPRVKKIFYARDVLFYFYPFRNLRRLFFRMTDPRFLPYVRVARFIARTFGPDCEVVLHDLTTPAHSVIHIENNGVTGRRIGDTFKHLVDKAMRSNETDDVFANHYYRCKGRLVRSSSLLIRDETGKLVGALCINADVTAVQAQLDFARRLLPGFVEELPPEASCPNRAPSSRRANAGSESLAALDPEASAEPTPTVLEIVCGLIDAAVAEACASGQLTKEKRLQVLEFLEGKNVFLVKGAIERTAERLGVAKVTVYSDLDAIRRR